MTCLVIKGDVKKKGGGRMIINKTELEAVAVKPSQYPPEDLAKISIKAAF